MTIRHSRRRTSMGESRTLPYADAGHACGIDKVDSATASL